jgi:hypothetical protein
MTTANVSKKKKKAEGGKQVTLNTLVSYLLADIRDEIVESGDDGGFIVSPDFAIESLPTATPLQLEVVKELKAGNLNLNKLFAAFGLEWKTYLSTLIVDVRDTECWWGKKVEEAKAKAAKTYQRKHDPLPFYECAQPLCRLVGPRQIFMLDQPDLYDDAGNPQVRYQCPDCKGYAITKSATTN